MTAETIKPVYNTIDWLLEKEGAVNSNLDKDVVEIFNLLPGYQEAKKTVIKTRFGVPNAEHLNTRRQKLAAIILEGDQKNLDHFILEILRLYQQEINKYALAILSSDKSIQQYANTKELLRKISSFIKKHETEFENIATVKQALSAAEKNNIIHIHLSMNKLKNSNLFNALDNLLNIPKSPKINVSSNEILITRIMDLDVFINKAKEQYKAILFQKAKDKNFRANTELFKEIILETIESNCEEEKTQKAYLADVDKAFAKYEQEARVYITVDWMLLPVNEKNNKIQITFEGIDQDVCTIIESLPEYQDYILNAKSDKNLSKVLLKIQTHAREKLLKLQTSSLDDFIKNILQLYQEQVNSFPTNTNKDDIINNTNNLLSLRTLVVDFIDKHRDKFNNIDETSKDIQETFSKHILYVYPSFNKLKRLDLIPSIKTLFYATELLSSLEHDEIGFKVKININDFLKNANTIYKELVFQNHKNKDEFKNIVLDVIAKNILDPNEKEKLTNEIEVSFNLSEVTQEIILESIVKFTNIATKFELNINIENNPITFTDFVKKLINTLKSSSGIKENTYIKLRRAIWDIINEHGDKIENLQEIKDSFPITHFYYPRHGQNVAFDNDIASVHLFSATATLNDGYRFSKKKTDEFIDSAIKKYKELLWENPKNAELLKNKVIDIITINIDDDIQRPIIRNQFKEECQKLDDIKKAYNTVDFMVNHPWKAYFRGFGYEFGSDRDNDVYRIINAIPKSFLTPTNPLSKLFNLNEIQKSKNLDTFILQILDIYAGLIKDNTIPRKEIKKFRRLILLYIQKHADNFEDIEQVKRKTEQSFKNISTQTTTSSIAIKGAIKNEAKLNLAKTAILTQEEDEAALENIFFQGNNLTGKSEIIVKHLNLLKASIIQGYNSPYELKTALENAISQLLVNLNSEDGVTFEESKLHYSPEKLKKIKSNLTEFCGTHYLKNVDYSGLNHLIQKAEDKKAFYSLKFKSIKDEPNNDSNLADLRKIVDFYDYIPPSHNEITSEDLKILNKIIENNDKNYAKFYQGILDTLKYISENPVKSVFRSYLPIPMRSLNKDIFDIARLLVVIGLKDVVPFLLEDLQIKDLNKIENIQLYRTNLQKFLDNLYTLFEMLSKSGELNDAALKKLKKSIHKFAEKNGFEKKIFNLQKLSAHDDSVGTVFSVTDDFKNSRKYAYIKDKVNDTQFKKVKTRRQKSALDWTSLIISIILGIGEGVVAAVFFGWVLLPALLTIGIAGAAVNYFLVRADSFETFKQLFITGVYKDETGHEVSNLKKWLIRGTILSCAATGVAFGLLSLHTALIAFGGILFGLTAAASLGFPPLGLLILTIFIASVTAIALATLYYVAIADFIKNDRWIGIKNYFKNNYIDIWMPEDWARMTKTQVAAYMAKTFLSCILNLIVLAIALSLAVILTVLSVGIFHHTSVKLLTHLTKMGTVLANKISSLLFNYVASPIASFFFSGGIIKRTIGQVWSGIKNIARKIMHPIDTWKNIKSGFENLWANKFLFWETVVNKVSTAFFFICAVANGAGQARGFAGDKTGISGVTSIANTVLRANGSISTKALYIPSFLSEFFGSFFANMSAVNARLKQDEPINLAQVTNETSTSKIVGELNKSNPKDIDEDKKSEKPLLLEVNAKQKEETLVQTSQNPHTIFANYRKEVLGKTEADYPKYPLPKAGAS